MKGEKRINNVIAIYFVQGLLPVQDKKTTCQKFGASIQQLHERVSRNWGSKCWNRHSPGSRRGHKTASRRILHPPVSAPSLLRSAPADTRGRCAIGGGGGRARTRRHASWPCRAGRRRGEDKVEVVADLNTFKSLLRVELNISNIKAITFNKCISWWDIGHVTTWSSRIFLRHLWGR